MSNRKRLTDIVSESDRSDLESAWESAVSAPEPDAVIPTGEYRCRVLSGECFTARRRGTKGFRLAFEIIDGPFARRRLWLDLWLTPNALPMTKRDLGKLGIRSLSQLDSPLPTGIIASVNVVVRKDDDGRERNQVRSFDVVGIEQPVVDPFAPEPHELAESEEGAPPY